MYMLQAMTLAIYESGYKLVMILKCQAQIFPALQFISILVKHNYFLQMFQCTNFEQTKLFPADVPVHKF